MGGYAPPKNPFKCAVCGQQFRSRSGHAKYCQRCLPTVILESATRSRRRNIEHYRAKGRATSVRFRAKIWQQVFSHYSYGTMACACCGEMQPEFLALDHINNDGSAERKIVRRLGSSFYYLLVKKGLPAGYQVLCQNCNMSKAKHGECVHKTRARGHATSGGEVPSGGDAHE